ncbi:MAG: hypothetical protein CMI09_16005 [Oceanospirillaceae bacterium]|nr:hypothetical protein [Oceanospirillaceae bacterium]
MRPLCSLRLLIAIVSLSLLAVAPARAFIGIFNVFIPVPGSEPVAWNDPGQAWVTRSSEHFELHFPEGFEGQATRALNIAEKVHTDLVPFFGQAPDHKTVMVLEDDVDYSNGWATPLPYAQIRLFASPPDDVTGLETYDDWLHLLIRHEYVHILHMEMSHGAPQFAGNVFGRHVLTFPHALTPSFLLEGLAVYLETNPEVGYGRLQGTLYEMQMREEVASGQFAPLTQVVVPNRDWPRNKAYLYGAFFIDYLVRKYGEDKLKGWLKRYSRMPVPYLFLDGSFRRFFGMPLSTLWRTFEYDMKERYLPVSKKLHKEATPYQSLPGEPWGLQIAQSVGHELYQLESNGEDSPAIWRYDLSLEQVQKQHLHDVKNVRYFDVSRTGNIAYIRLLANADLRVEGDIFLRHADGDETRLTHRLRARRLQWLPDETGFVVSRIRSGHSELLKVDLNGDTQVLWRGQYGEVIGDLDLSEDGLRVVAAFKPDGQTWNLAVYNLTSGQWKTLTQTPAIEGSPRWLDDENILYSADYHGNYDLYSLNMESGEVMQWTRESTGAFRPLKVADKLVYQRYTADGYLSVLSQQKESVSKEAIASLNGDTVFPGVAMTRTAQDGDEEYSPWSTLLPTAWYPSLYGDGVQWVANVMIPGTDALGKHYYLFNISYETKYHMTPVSLLYLYDNRWQLFASHSYEYNDVDFNERDQRVRRELFIGQRRYLGHWMDDQLGLHAGITVEHEELIESVGLPWSDGPLGERNLAGLALVWTELEGHLHVPGIGRGTYWDLVGETNQGGSYEGNVFQARGAKVFDLPGRNKISLSGEVGWADVAAKPFELGGSASEFTLFGRNEALLLGYEERIQVGNQYATQRLAVTGFLGSRERNWRLYPFGWGDFFGTVFVENGSAWRDDDAPDWLGSAGIELHSELVFAYDAVVPISLRWTHGFEEPDRQQNISISFGYRY